MLSLLIAAALLQASPEAPAAAPPAIHESNLPKDDYGLVAWCHGALAGQLELDAVAKADMEKIEGKAKVAARARSDAEMEKDRRQYLKDYEHALAAAEAASPVAIHQRGVQAEQQGYKLWTATRNKEPIWRMLDWGMWDPNDAGCGDAAKRLYDRSTLLGVALKTSEGPATDAATDEAVTKSEEPPATPLTGYGPSKTEAAPFSRDAAAEAPPPVDAQAAPAAEQSAPPPPGEPTEAALKTLPPVKAVSAKKPAKVAAKPPVKKPVATPTPVEVSTEAPPAPRVEAQPAPATEQPTPPPAATNQDAPVVSATASSEATETPVALPKAAVVKKPAKPAAKPALKPAAKPAARPAKAKPAGMSAEDIRAAIARGKAETGVPLETPPPAPADKPAAKPDGAALELRGSLHP